ncbi:stage III sporulation protein AF [Brevibacillus fluminis]|uniref:Stage III sporulation protein AF n=1 Tax=Brevibacillus fluminis TaxID=511487 RepID=A0A3M8D159_9BACL|nr:stage III sporulation protein AF [Brevibacillus fluminis]RNB81147.1 stage III sporulation protein AF [Brevibacillus fluminis]
MEWLSLWLKKIILLVLLAAFLDLILPNTNLQRYVKMVMGLIILLTIMSPLFTIFNLSQDQLALKMSRYQQEMTNTTDSDIKGLTNRILSTQDEQAHQYVQEQMEAMIREQVKESYGVELAQVNVNIEKKDQAARIASIDLVVAEQGEKPSVERVTPVIKPIEPVRIEVGQEQAATAQAPKTEATATQTNPLYLQIRDTVAQSWALAPKQVEVTGEQAREEK